MRYLQQEKGNALLSVMVIVVIFMSICIASLVSITQITKLNSIERRRSQAFSVAEAGLERSIWLIERQAIPDDQFVGNQYSFDGYNEEGSYSVVIKRDDYNEYHYTATSTGTYTASNPPQVKKVAQEMYFLSMQKSVFSYGAVNGGGTVTGNVELRGPFYCGGDFSVGGTTTIKNPDGSTGNPVMVRGNLDISSGSVEIGGNTAQVGPESPMAVFVKGTINNPNQVHDLTSTQVPLVTMPPVVPSRYLDAAEANDYAVYNGNITLSSSNIQFGRRPDGSYTFDYNGSTRHLTIEGVVYVDGNFTVQRDITYYHPSGFTQATIYVNKQLVIGDDVICGGTYPTQSMLSFVNPDVPGVTEDISIAFSSNPTVYAFFYSGGTIDIHKQINVHGTVIANNILFEQVPSIYVPTDLGNNYPELFPGKDIAFVATSKWREVP
jgi:hypothetical protein